MSARGAGFTLVELVIACTMLALVTLGVVTSVSAALNAWGRTSAAGEADQAQAVLRQIAAELASQAAVPEGAFLFSEDSGEGLPMDTLTFVCPRREAVGEVWRALQAQDAGEQLDWEPVAQLSQVDYALDTGDQPGLYRRELYPAPAEPRDEGDWLLFCPQVTGFDVAWYDGTEWVDGWDQAQAPLAGRITLLVDDGQGGEYALAAVVPVAPSFDPPEQNEGAAE